jgi:hypothetical protein
MRKWGLQARWGRSMALWLVAMGLLGGLVAQNRVHLGIGYNQSYARLDSLNYILNAFNTENPWTVDKPMHEIHAPVGVTAHIGADFAGVLVDFHYTMRAAGTSARSDSASNPQAIQVRYNASTLDLGVGWFAIKRPRFRLAIGQTIDFGNLRVSARRSTNPPQPSQLFGRYINELNFGTSSFLHMMISFQDGVGPGIFIRPYFQIGLRKNDYGPLNRAIRPTESLSDPLFLLGRQSNIGLKIGVFLGS